MKLVCSLILLLVATNFYSCTSSNDPEGALRKYINYRFEENQSRAVILTQVTGDLYTEIENMSDEDFEKFSKVEYKKRNLKVILKKCTPEQCYITYTLRYDIKSGDTKTYAAEIKKIANLKSVDGKWKIGDVTNVKTYYDSKEPL